MCLSYMLEASIAGQTPIVRHIQQYFSIINHISNAY